MIKPSHKGHYMKLQVSLEILISMSIAMLIAVYLLSSFGRTYFGFNTIHENMSKAICNAINMSNRISAECSSCINIVKNEC